jgi:probable rRNA maturation factor
MQPTSHKPTLSLFIQYADSSLAHLISRPLLRRWVKASLFKPAVLTLRFVDAEEGRALNRDYRGKDYATNVLTFDYSDPIGDTSLTQKVQEISTNSKNLSQSVQADIIFCSPVLEQEAHQQEKSLAAHVAHLVIHGVLHAQGFDHETEAEAVAMETLEISILSKLGFSNPYQISAIN